MPRRYPPGFRHKVLDLIASGRRVAQVAANLDISVQTMYAWRHHELIDSGRLPGTTSAHNAELVAAPRRIARTRSRGRRRGRHCRTRFGCGPARTSPR
ncbi:helix-turn-helix domain-containing protein [Actinosynnema sp. NPDC023658]|uniref:helix-turn-helix domain-containing protein n=1 Tax=Actinosynnema sp. NPDC023658 TaxID=3155465 RepID=UPI0033C6431B